MKITSELKMTPEQEDAFKNLVHALLECERKDVFILNSEGSISGLNGKKIQYILSECDFDYDADDPAFVPIESIEDDAVTSDEFSFGFIGPAVASDHFYATHVRLKEANDPKAFEIYEGLYENRYARTQDDMTLLCSCATIAEVIAFLQVKFDSLGKFLVPEEVASQLRYGAGRVQSLLPDDNKLFRVIAKYARIAA